MDKRKINRILRGKNATVEEAGELLFEHALQAVCNDKQILTNEELTQLQRNTYNDNSNAMELYKVMCTSLLLLFYPGSSRWRQQYYHGYHRLFLNLVRASDAEERLREFENVPYLMDTENLAHIKKTLTTKLERLQVSIDYIVIRLMHYYINNLDKAPKKFTEAIEQYKSQPIKEKAFCKQIANIYNIGYWQLWTGEKVDSHASPTTWEKALETASTKFRDHKGNTQEVLLDKLKYIGFKGIAPMLEGFNKHNIQEPLSDNLLTVLTCFTRALMYDYSSIGELVKHLNTGDTLYNGVLFDPTITKLLNCNEEYKAIFDDLRGFMTFKNYTEEELPYKTMYDFLTLNIPNTAVDEDKSILYKMKIFPIEISPDKEPPAYKESTQYQVLDMHFTAVTKEVRKAFIENLGLSPSDTKRFQFKKVYKSFPIVFANDYKITKEDIAHYWYTHRKKKRKGKAKEETIQAMLDFLSYRRIQKSGVALVDGITQEAEQYNHVKKSLLTGSILELTSYDEEIIEGSYETLVLPSIKRLIAINEIATLMSKLAESVNFSKLYIDMDSLNTSMKTYNTYLYKLCSTNYGQVKVKEQKELRVKKIFPIMDIDTISAPIKRKALELGLETVEALMLKEPKKIATLIEVYQNPESCIYYLLQ